MNRTAPVRVSVVLIPETVASAVLSVYDIFRLFADVVPDKAPYEVAIVGHTTEPMPTSSSVSLQAHHTFETVPPCDIVIMPALMLSDSGWTLGRYPGLIAWLRSSYEQGAILCSACSGIFPLMETGLFDAEPVTCHWYYEPGLRKCFPQANIRIDKAFIVGGDDDRLVMSGASASWHDLVLYLISRFSSPAAASAVSRFFMINWHPEGQAPYACFLEETGHGDAAILEAQARIRQHWMHANLVEELVRHSGLAERSFMRRFKTATGRTPMEYIQRIRIEHARDLLEGSALPVDTIAAEIGYEDPAFFRKLFKRITSMTPSAYRLKFRTPYRAVS